MDHHYDRKIIYSTEREHKSLYEWSLKELDDEGQQVGRDWIPWSWALYFKANGISLQESWRTQERYPVDPTKGKRETTERKFIRAELYPHTPDRWPPSYSMLGTDRKMSKFILQIEQIADDQEERCTAYGVVSYTSEIDFRDVTDDDSLWIYFHLHAATFDHYAQRIASTDVDSLMVRIADVPGFYSDWSPSITTNKIGILTDNRDHKVEGVPEKFALRRLGEVGEAELYFAREINLPLAASEPDDTDNVVIDRDGPPRDRTMSEIDRDEPAKALVKLLQNLRIAAWLAAAALLVLLFK